MTPPLNPKSPLSAARQAEKEQQTLGENETGELTTAPDRSESEWTALERTQELFDFLQGTVPKLSPDQAWAVIWYLGNQYWKVTDYVERCDVCGCLYDSNQEGGILDYGQAPYHFCDECMAGEEYITKEARRSKSVL